MKPLHVIQFADYYIEKYKARCDASKLEFDNAQKRYNSASWLNRLIMLKPREAHFEHSWVSKWIRGLTDLRHEAVYKYNRDCADMEIARVHRAAFYEWAALYNPL